MLQNFLKQRNYPFIIFLKTPKNHLDLFSFILFIGYCILKYTFVLHVWYDLLITSIFFIITLIFNKYKWSINHAKSFSLFFVIWFLLEVLY